MTKIFISYHNDESKAIEDKKKIVNYGNGLAKFLEIYFGVGSVYFAQRIINERSHSEISTILRERITSASVVVFLIGDDWIEENERKTKGFTTIDNAFVFFELKHAIDLGKEIVLLHINYSKNIFIEAIKEVAEKNKHGNAPPPFLSYLEDLSTKIYMYVGIEFDNGFDSVHPKLHYLRFYIAFHLHAEYSFHNQKRFLDIKNNSSRWEMEESRKNSIMSILTKLVETEDKPEIPWQDDDARLASRMVGHLNNGHAKDCDSIYKSVLQSLIFCTLTKSFRLHFEIKNGLEHNQAATQVLPIPLENPVFATVFFLCMLTKPFVLDMMWNDSNQLETTHILPTNLAKLGCLGLTGTNIDNELITKAFKHSESSIEYIAIAISKDDMITLEETWPIINSLLNWHDEALRKLFFHIDASTSGRGSGLDLSDYKKRHLAAASPSIGGQQLFQNEKETMGIFRKMAPSRKQR